MLEGMRGLVLASYPGLPSQLFSQPSLNQPQQSHLSEELLSWLHEVYAAYKAGHGIMHALCRMEESEVYVPCTHADTKVN